MELKITKEKTDIIFQCNEDTPSSKINAEKIGKNLFICRTVEDAELCMKQIVDLGELDDTKPLLCKTYIVEAEENDEELMYILAGSIFVPQFKTEDLTVSDITFFTDKNDESYRVRFTYDFDEKFKIEIYRFLSSENTISKNLQDIQMIMEDIKEGVEQCGEGL